MSFRLERLEIVGPGKLPAEIDFNAPATVVFGPSETGKSYISDCIGFCLGGGTIPEDVPPRDGYVAAYLQVRAASDAQPIAQVVERDLFTGIDESAGDDVLLSDSDAENEENAAASEPNSAQDVSSSVYTFVRSLHGGETVVYPCAIKDVGMSTKLTASAEEVFRRLSGVDGRIVVKKAGGKGVIGGGPLRHWMLLSQTNIVLKETVLGADTFGRAERSAALSLFLTGQDDAAIETGTSTDERRLAVGGANAILQMIEKFRADIPEGAVRDEVESALQRVDATLKALSDQQKSRALTLERVRGNISELSKKIRAADVKLRQSGGLVSRFKLLDEKFKNDIARLVSLSEGREVYRLLDNVPCALCGTTIETHAKSDLTSSSAERQQFRAIAVEAEKIEKQQTGLKAALAYEDEEYFEWAEYRAELEEKFAHWSEQERLLIESGIDEFQVSATDLAERKTELFTQVKAFDQIQRLTREAAELKKIGQTRNASIERHLAKDGLELSDLVMALLKSWGFDAIRQVSFDSTTFDILIDGRRRASYGQGVRALFLAAYYIALLQYAGQAGRPHPGIVVIDSPLKSFANKKKRLKTVASTGEVRDINAEAPEIDPTEQHSGAGSAARDTFVGVAESAESSADEELVVPQEGDPRVVLSTLEAKFYDWLSKWNGPGQLVIIENAEPAPEHTEILKPIEFTDDFDDGRQGFYPRVRPDKVAEIVSPSEARL